LRENTGAAVSYMSQPAAAAGSYRALTAVRLLVAAARALDGHVLADSPSALSAPAPALAAAVDSLRLRPQNRKGVTWSGTGRLQRGHEYISAAEGDPVAFQRQGMSM
jgi:hypothetical protein